MYQNSQVKSSTGMLEATLPGGIAEALDSALMA